MISIFFNKILPPSPPFLGVFLGFGAPPKLDFWDFFMGEKIGQKKGEKSKKEENKGKKKKPKTWGKGALKSVPK